MANYHARPGGGLAPALQDAEHERDSRRLRRRGAPRAAPHPVVPRRRPERRHRRRARLDLGEVDPPGRGQGELEQRRPADDADLFDLVLAPPDRGRSRRPRRSPRRPGRRRARRRRRGVRTMLMRPGSGRRGRLSQVRRPMITGLPRVSARKSARSDFSRQGRRPPRPMTPLAARATGPRVRMRPSDRDRRLDGRVGAIALESDVVFLEGEEVVLRARGAGSGTGRARAPAAAAPGRGGSGRGARRRGCGRTRRRLQAGACAIIASAARSWRC